MAKRGRDVVKLRLDPSETGFCEGCKKAAVYLRTCDRADCSAFRCAYCMPAHLETHDPGGLGLPKSHEEPAVEVEAVSEYTSGRNENIAKWFAYGAALVVLILIHWRVALDNIDTKNAITEQGKALARIENRTSNVEQAVKDAKADRETRLAQLERQIEIQMGKERSR